MAQPTKWLADGRVLRRRSEFKAGTSNPFLNNADLVDLNDLVYQIVYNIIPGTPTGPLNVQNGITGTVTPTTFDIELGGILTENTTIDGDTNYDFIVENSRTINLDSTFLELSGDTMYIADASLAGASAGDVWTLVNNTTGEGAWQAPVGIANAANGLNLQSTTVRLGGPLDGDTTIDGATNLWGLTIEDLSQLTLNALQTYITANTSIDVDSATVNIISPVSLTMKTPGYGSAVNRTHALHILNTSTGEAEFKALNFFPIKTADTNSYSVADGSSTILVDAAVAAPVPGTCLVELPDPTLNEGMLVRVKLISAGTMTISAVGVGNTIFTSTDVPSIVENVVGTVYTLQSDGTYWQVL